MRPAFGLIFAVALFGAGLATAEEEDPWRLDVSGPRSADQAVARALTGLGDDKVRVGTNDLDLDGFPEFFVFADGRNSLMRLGPDGWTDISGGALQGVAGPSDLTFRDEWFNGFQILRAGGELRIMQNGALALRSSIAPGRLDATAFARACIASPGLGAPGEDGIIFVDSQEYCACLAEEWGARSGDQRLFDAWTQALTDRSKLDLSDEEYERYDQLAGEAQQSCDQRSGRGTGLTRPAETPFNGSPMPDNAAEFVAVCRSQDYVIANRKVRNADRALGLCACIAAQLTVDGLDAEGFRLVSALYSGEMSDAEVAEISAVPAEKSDAAAFNCLRMMPKR